MNVSNSTLSVPSSLASEAGNLGNAQSGSNAHSHQLAQQSHNQQVTSHAATGSASAAATKPRSRACGAHERNSLTLNQRRSLRLWANSQPNRPSHRACQEWFEQEYGQVISQSTVSHSLSPKYSRLDNEAPQLHGSRMRFGNWPNVEKLVLKWYQQVQQTGRHPTNEELAEKAKNVFTALPQYKDNPAPEFSPGWIHRFKKRYGLLIRRQRRHGDVENPAEDIPYLAESLQRGSCTITSETSPAAVRELINRSVGVEPTLNICALVRDEVIRRNNSPGLSGSTSVMSIAAAAHAHAANSMSVQNSGEHATSGVPGSVDSSVSDQSQLFADDAEIVLQSAIRQLEAENAAAEATAAAVREERDRLDQLRQSVLTPSRQQSNAHAHTQPSSAATPAPGAGGPHVGHGNHPRPIGENGLTLTPIDSSAPLPVRDRPLRCPFCVNQRLLKSIKDAVEHMSTHVEV